MVEKDILYFGTLFICIAIGRFYKKLENVEMKKNYGAGLGFLVTVLVCRQYAMYLMALVWGNIMIIKCSDKRYVNELSISYSWLLLVYVTYNVGPDDYILYITQIIALRLVGLASEINRAEYERLDLINNPLRKTGTSGEKQEPNPVVTAVKALTLATKKVTSTTSAETTAGKPGTPAAQPGTQTSKPKPSGTKPTPPATKPTPPETKPTPPETKPTPPEAKSSETKASLSKSSSILDILHKKEEPNVLELNAIDVCVYAYHFIGIHKGPYYAFREYVYHFDSPFSKLGNFRLITSEKLKKVLLYTLAYAVLRVKFSTKIYYEEYFYKPDYNTELRFLYNVPLLIMYALRNEILVMLSTCVFTEAGFGVYPAMCAATPGQGPTAFEYLLQPNSDAVTHASDYEYNFAILRCFDNRRLIFGPKMQDTLNNWDIATKYWFWHHIYHSSSMRNLRKEVRSAAAFVAWAIWSGLSVTHLILVATLWVWVNLEHEYSMLYNANDPSVRASWNSGFSIMRGLCLIYLTPCFVINDSFAVLRFYNSISWILHIILLALLIMAIALFKVTLRTERVLRS